MMDGLYWPTVSAQIPLLPGGGGLSTGTAAVVCLSGAAPLGETSPCHCHSPMSLLKEGVFLKSAEAQPVMWSLMGDLDILSWALSIPGVSSQAGPPDRLNRTGSMGFMRCVQSEPISSTG